MKIIITGASSFIGRALIRKLASAGDMIYAVVRKPEDRSGFLNEIDRVKPVECPMADYGELDKKIGGSCDGMIHLAWEGTRGTAREDRFLQEENCRQSMKAVEAAAALGCRWIVLAGSQAEYGIYPDQQISEDMQSRPLTAYGCSKLFLYNIAEEFCAHRGIRLLEPRFFSVYGPLDWENSLIMSCLKHMIANEDCLLTECVQNWNYLYIDDAADGIIRLIRDGDANGIYNLASPDTRVLKQFIYEMYDLTGSRSRLLFGALSYPETGMVSMMPDCSKIQKQTGWTATTSFSAGIGRILEEDNRFLK